MPLSITERSTLDDIKEGVQFVRDKVIQHDTELHDILGNGQPGRLARLEETVNDLSNLRWKMVGIVIGIVFIMEGSHIGLEKLFEFLKK